MKPGKSYQTRPSDSGKEFGVDPGLRRPRKKYQTGQSDDGHGFGKGKNKYVGDEPLKTELNNQGDYVSGDVGPDGKDVVVGKNIDTRRTRQRNQQQNQRSGDISFNNSDNAVIWQELMRVSEKLDSLPDRVGRLEKTEVVIRPASEVVVRSASDSVNLSVRMIFTILGVALLVALIMVGFLIYWQVSHV